MDEIESLKAENETLKRKLTEIQQECDRLLDCLEDAQREAGNTKRWANTLHNELLSLRGQVAAYKHCIAAMTGTEIPVDKQTDRT